MDETGLSQWRDRWTAAGIPTIPLHPYSKEPVCKAWQVRSSADQWDQVGGPRFRGNIGVVTGGPVGEKTVAVADGDTPETVEAIRAGFSAMGIDPDGLPAVSTTKPGNRHFYITIAGAPEGNYVNLSRSVGKGELRFGPGAYVAAPCSLVDGIRYRFVSGAPEAIAGLRPIAWRDLRWMVAPTTYVQVSIDSPPVRLVRRDMPARARWLLDNLAATSGPTRPFLGYASRSEGECAAVAMLILAGWTFAEIQGEFARSLPGHYRDNGNRERCIEREYNNVLGFLASCENRAEIAGTYRAAELAPWPGRGGGLERSVTLALLATAWQWDSWTVGASIRDIAEHAAGSKRGVSNALARLQERGLVRRVQGWTWDARGRTARATLWDLSACPIGSLKSHGVEIVAGQAGAGGARTDAESAESGSAVYLLCMGESEVWAWARLGRSAGAVYAHLGVEPLEVQELAEATGKHRNTVSAALRRLEAYGLSEHGRGGWVRGPAALDGVARELDAVACARRRRLAHSLQRDGWYHHIECGGFRGERNGQAGSDFHCGEGHETHAALC